MGGGRDAFASSLPRIRRMSGPRPPQQVHAANGSYYGAQEFLQPLALRNPPKASLNLAEAERKLGNSKTAIQILVAASVTNPDKLVHYA